MSILVSIIASMMFGFVVGYIVRHKIETVEAENRKILEFQEFMKRKNNHSFRVIPKN